MANNRFCTSCKYFEKSPDNCGRKNGKYGLCKYGVRQGFCPRIVNYQHPVCEVFKDKIEAVKCSAATTLFGTANTQCQRATSEQVSR